MNCENILTIISNNTNIVTIIGIAVSASVLMLQSHRQHRSNLKLQKENIKDDLKRKMQAEIEEAVSKASDAKTRASGLFHNLYYIEYPSIKNSLENGIRTAGFRTTANDFSKAYEDMRNSAIELIMLIEKYEIIQPEIKIFQTAINVALHEMRENYIRILQQMLIFLPQIAPPGAIGNQEAMIISKPFPNDVTMESFKNTYEPFQEALEDLGCWLGDFRVEIQNLWLGKLFNNTVPRRTTINKKYLVITTDKKSIKKLNDYFESETNWGKTKKEAEDEARKEAVPIENTYP